MNHQLVRLLLILVHNDLITKTLSITSSLVSLSVQLIFCVRLQRHVLNDSILLVSSFTIIHSSDAHNITFQINVFFFSDVRGNIFLDKKKEIFLFLFNSTAVGIFSLLFPCRMSRLN